MLPGLGNCLARLTPPASSMQLSQLSPPPNTSRDITFGPPSPQERKEEQERYALPVPPFHLPFHAQTGPASTGRRGDKPPSFRTHPRPLLVHAQTGGRAGGFAPSLPSYTPAPTLTREQDTQTQDDAGRRGNRFPLVPARIHAQTGGRAGGFTPSPLVPPLPSTREGTCKVRPTLFSPSRLRSPAKRPPG
ncbi:hypothetical protein V8E53_002282 [Lactarius tabidus]